MSSSLRRLFLICASSALVMALFVGSLFLWAVAVDWYPIVPSEGFSTGEKMGAVFQGAFLGAAIGLVIGVLMFLLSLVRDKAGNHD